MEKNVYDKHGNAQHYDGRINALILIERTWGTYEAMVFCEITAMKYRIRLGKKDDPILELTKLKWYEQQAARLRKILGTAEEIKYPFEQPNILLGPKDNRPACSCLLKTDCYFGTSSYINNGVKCIIDKMAVSASSEDYPYRD